MVVIDTRLPVTFGTKCECSAPRTDGVARGIGIAFAVSGVATAFANKGKEIVRRSLWHFEGRGVVVVNGSSEGVGHFQTTDEFPA